MTHPPSYRAESPELRLLLAAAAWPQAPSDQAYLAELLAGDFDHDRFLHLVTHHRLAPLVAEPIRTAAPIHRVELADELAQLAQQNTYRALRSLSEMRRLLLSLTEAGIPVQVLKGLPLAQSVFGDLSLRSAGDLDLLVPEDSLLLADRVLRDAGYQGLFSLDRFSPRQLSFYRTHWKDVAYISPETGYEVDLHWRCFRNREMPGAALCAPGLEQTVSFGNFQVSTLPPTENLLYLCVHGTLDGWLYLKSLVDVAAQVRPMQASELDAVAEAALRYGVLPELSAALWLVRRYFSMQAWSTSLLPAEEKTVAHILRFSGAALEDHGFLADRDDISTRATVLFELGLRDTAPYRKELLLRILFRARMWQTLPLPDSLFWLYPFLSPLEWVAFRLARRRTRSPEPR